jgi:hypothetical protein
MRRRAGRPVFLLMEYPRKENQPDGAWEKQESQSPMEVIRGSDNPASLPGHPQCAGHTFPAIVFFVCA